MRDLKLAFFGAIALAIIYFGMLYYYPPYEVKGLTMLPHSEQVKDIQWGLRPVSGDKDLVGENIFEIEDKYRIQQDVGVLHLRVYGRKHSRWYTGMTRLFLTPHEGFMVLQAKRDEVRVIEKQSYLYPRLSAMFFQKKGDIISVADKHIKGENRHIGSNSPSWAMNGFITH